MKKLLILTTILFPIAAFAGNTNNGVGNSIQANTYNSPSKNYNTNKNTNKQYQEQFQSQRQYQSAQTNGSVDNNIAYNDNHPVSSAFAPPLVAGGESCMGATSAAGQGFSFGASFGSTWHDESCERRKDSITIYNMGEHKAALALLCQDEHIHKAMNAFGKFRCPVEEATGSSINSSVGNNYPTQPRH